MNLAIWLERAARLCPQAPALLRGTRVVADYASFDARARRLGGTLTRDFRVSAGDRVAIFMENATEYLEILYAVWIAGAVVVPINAKLHPREAAWIIGNAGAQTIFAADSQLAGLRALPELAGHRIIDALSPDFAAACLHGPGAEVASRQPDDTAWLFYTSGTTGRPKGVMLSHGNLMAMAQAYFVDVDSVDPDDCILYAAPMSHGAGLYNFMFTLRGARHVIPVSGGFDAAEIAAIAPPLGGVCLFAAPTMVRRMVAQARETGFDGTGIKTVVYGGGPMYRADIIEATERFGPRFVQIYGQGECPMGITALSRAQVADRAHPRWQQRIGSVGVAQSCVEVRIAAEDGTPRPAGEIGEIMVRGAPVMQGYWANPEATSRAIRDGWLLTGDLGAADEDGFITLHDRSRDMIVSGGSNIYPREVEEVLLSHPAVAQVSVVGAPDPEWGEIVVAFVVPEPGATLDPAALDAQCLEHIARFKRPKRYEVVADLPKNAYGKVLKTELRALLGR